MSYSDEEYESVCGSLKIAEVRLAAALKIIDRMTLQIDESNRILDFAREELEKLRGESSTNEERVHTD
jgi:hypothetical protein